MPLKITYISQTCPPEPGATKRPLEQAKVLAELGHEVTFITAFPSYPYGRVYQGYRNKFWSRENINGVSVLRVWSVPTPANGIFHRLVSYITFSVSAVVAGLFVRPADVVIGSVPNIFTELSAWILSRFGKNVFVLELRDIMPDNLITAGFGRTNIGYKLFDYYYRWIYQQVDIFALAYQWMPQSLHSRGVNGVMLILSHAVDRMETTMSRKKIRDELGVAGRFVVTYAGSFSAYYKVPFLIDVAGLLIEKLPHVLIIAIGTGADYELVRDTVLRRGITNIILAGGVEPAAVYKYLLASDLLVHPQLLPNIMDGTKILEYLSAGKPILNISIHKAAEGQAEALNIGKSISPLHAAQMVNAIEYYLQNNNEIEIVGNIAKRLVHNRYERHKVVAQFAKELEETVAAFDKKKNI